MGSHFHTPSSNQLMKVKPMSSMDWRRQNLLQMSWRKHSEMTRNGHRSHWVGQLSMNNQIHSQTSTGPPICTTEAALATKENNDRTKNGPHEHVKLREPCQKSVKHFGMDNFDIWKAARANECANTLSCPTAG